MLNNEKWWSCRAEEAYVEKGTLNVWCRKKLDFGTKQFKNLNKSLPTYFRIQITIHSSHHENPSINTFLQAPIFAFNYYTSQFKSTEMIIMHSFQGLWFSYRKLIFLHEQKCNKKIQILLTQHENCIKSLSCTDLHFIFYIFANRLITLKEKISWYIYVVFVLCMFTLQFVFVFSRCKAWIFDCGPRKFIERVLIMKESFGEYSWVSNVRYCKWSIQKLRYA